jgi:hypothetical protein
VGSVRRDGSSVFTSSTNGVHFTLLVDHGYSRKFLEDVSFVNNLKLAGSTESVGKWIIC